MYFANGTDGMIFEESLCAYCIHDRDDEQCPVLAVHMLFNYDQHDNKELKEVLDILIPSSDQCAMFKAVSNEQEV